MGYGPIVRFKVKLLKNRVVQKKNLGGHLPTQAFSWLK